MIRSCAELQAAALTGTDDAAGAPKVHIARLNIYGGKVQEGDSSEDCAVVTPSLVTTIANEHFGTNFTIIFFDDFYHADFTFKWILDKIIKGLKYSTIKFGRKKDVLKKNIENEQPSWVIFSSQMDVMDRKTLLISHNSPFQVKEWLTTPLATKYMNIIAVPDPKLQKFQGRENDCDVGLYTHSFNANLAAKAFIITSWRKNNFTQKVNLFPNKFKDGYNGVHLVISVESQPPFAFKRTDHNKELVWDGLEVRLIYYLAEVLNFTIEFKEVISDKHRNEVLEDLMAKRAGLGIGRQIATPSSNKAVTLTYPYSVDCASFMSLTSTALPKYRAIMGPFLWDVWLALTAVYLLAIFPISFSAWHTIQPLLDHPAELENMFWYVFGTFTNCFTFSGEHSWTKDAKCSTKLFIGTYWVFTIIITACYTGSIIAFITLPVYPEVVDTMYQLLHKNYRVTTLDKDGWWDLLTAADDDEASGLAGTAETVSNILDGIRSVVLSAKEDKPVAFLCSTELLTYILKANYTTSDVGKRRMFHMSKQCFAPLFVALTLPPGSLYSETLNAAIMRAIEAGLLQKFTKDMEWLIYKSSERYQLQGVLKFDALERQLTLDDTQGMFLLLGCGCGFAICVFVFEIGTWLKNREGEDLTSIAKEKILHLSRRVSNVLLMPASSHVRQHYPLYFKSNYWRSSSVFGSVVEVNGRTLAFSDVNLKSLQAEKPIRLLSF